MAETKEKVEQLITDDQKYAEKDGQSEKKPEEVTVTLQAGAVDTTDGKKEAGDGNDEEEDFEDDLDDENPNDAEVPRWLIKTCQYMWRAPVLPMIWLGLIFSLFWTIFGLVQDLEVEYDKVSPVGCCGMIVDDATDPLNVNEIEGISSLCRLSNLTGEWITADGQGTEKLFLVREETENVGDSTEDHLHCFNRATSNPTDCDTGVDGQTIVECLSASTLKAGDVCTKGAIEDTFKSEIRDKIVEKFLLLRAYCFLVLFFTLVLFCTSIYLWKLIPATTKGGHTTFHLCQIFLYIMPSLALIVFIMIMYDIASLDSWLDPYEDTGVISIEGSNNAQVYTSVNCANMNNVIFLDADQTVSNGDDLDESADAIKTVLTFAGIMCAWPMINCVMGMTITGGDLCLASAD